MSIRRRFSGAGIRRAVRCPDEAGGASLLTFPDANAVAWYEPRAAENTLDVNGDLQVLEDLTGNGNDLTALRSATQRAVVTPSSADYGGAAVGTWTGAKGGGYQRVTLATGLLAQPCSYFYVCDYTGSGTRGLMDGGSASNRQYFLAVNTSISVQASAGTLATFSSLLTTDTPAVVCLIVNGASTVVYVDDMATPANSGDMGTGGLGGLTIGSLFTGSSAFTGRLAHHSVHGIAMDEAQRTAVAAYLTQEFPI